MRPNEPDDRLTSRLPADPEYWNALANRIVTGAAPLLEEHRTWAPWWKPLARFGPSLGITAAAAAAAVVIAIAPGHRAAPDQGRQFQQALVLVVLG